MADQMNNTVINKPTVTTEPIQPPTLNAYNQPTVDVKKPTADASQFGYQQPANSFTSKNINQGLLEFNPTKSGQMQFNQQGVNTENLGVQTAQVPQYQAGQDFISDGALVEKRVQGLLDPNNDMNRLVQANVKAKMNARGIAGSSIDDTSSQSAMIQNALQIATPDAQTVATADLNRQGATYGSQRANQDTTNQGNLATHQTNLQGAINNQNAGLEWDKTNLQGAITGDLNQQKGNIAGAQKDQQAAYDHDARNQQGLLEGARATQDAKIRAELQGMESVNSQNMMLLEDKLNSSRQFTQEQNQAIMQAFQETQKQYSQGIEHEYSRVIAQAQLNAEDRGKLAGAMQQMASDYEISVQNVLLDQNLTAEAKNAAITRINNIFNQDMANIASVFGVEYSDADDGAPTAP
ncbi:MAG: hypothetical protein IH612_10310 [Desulfofustis sp.]|nr:hypothetical protein [Desulfofustis sp.]